MKREGMAGFSTDPVESLIAELARHPVNTNRFFEAFRDRTLDTEQFQIFLRQYHYFCKHFVKSLEGLLYRTPVDELDMRVELIKTLYSELGNGRSEHAHITQLERFAAAAGLDPADLQQTRPLPEVAAYLLTLNRLFTQSDYLVALGAELAVETTAASEFRHFYPGLQKYPAFSEADLSFFRSHLEEEQAHSDWLAEAVRRTVRSPMDLDAVSAGAREAADAWHRFWLGMHQTVFPEASGSSSPEREAS